MCHTLKRKGRIWSGVLSAILLVILLMPAGTAAGDDSYESFLEAIGGQLFFLAWPTATYEGMKFGGIDYVTGGADVKVKLYGESTFGGNLWGELVVVVRDGQLEDVRWGRNNAILVQPGSTITTLGEALAEIMADYQGSAPGTGAAQPIAGTGSSFSSGWRICNKSNAPEVWVAYSYLDETGWVTKGWRSIDRGQCEVLLNRIDNRYLYYYAESRSGKWAGTMKLCTHPKDKFTFRGETCSAGYELYSYQQVDVGNSASWTTNLVE